jgi:dihydroneopterin aldolase
MMHVSLKTARGQTLHEKLAGTDYHIIDDLAYSLSERLLKSYRRVGAIEVCMINKKN